LCFDFFLVGLRLCHVGILRCVLLFLVGLALCSVLFLVGFRLCLGGITASVGSLFRRGRLRYLRGFLVGVGLRRCLVLVRRCLRLRGVVLCFGLLLVGARLRLGLFVVRLQLRFAGVGGGGLREYGGDQHGGCESSDDLLHGLKLP